MSNHILLLCVLFSREFQIWLKYLNVSWMIIICPPNFPYLDRSSQYPCWALQQKPLKSLSRTHARGERCHFLLSQNSISCFLSWGIFSLGYESALSALYLKWSLLLKVKNLNLMCYNSIHFCFLWKPQVSKCIKISRNMLLIKVM